MQAKKDKLNKNIYKQKQTNEKTGENNKLANNFSTIKVVFG